MQHYFSFIEQTLHYFDRPHDGVPLEPLQSPAAWRGDTLPPLEQLAYQLSEQEVTEVRRAVEVVTAQGLATLDLTVEDFPLPLLAPRIGEWRKVLSSGLGLQVLRGVPVQDWTQEECERFFWCFGLHLGRPGQQNPEGHLLGHVRDISGERDEPMARLYKTAQNIDYHCDAADVVGLLCLHAASSGGHSRIASSVTVFNELLARRPELVARLFAPFHLDVRDRGIDEAGSTLQIPPCCFAAGQLRTFYHADYFRSVSRHSDVPDLSALERELLDTYEAIASEVGIYLDMDLQPGDIQLLSNHTVLHARTAYEDYPEPERRRHLLRLWLSL